MFKTTKPKICNKQSKPNKTQSKNLVIHSFDVKKGLSLFEKYPSYYAIASKNYAKHQQRIHYDMPVYVSFLDNECTLDKFNVTNKPDFLKKSIFKDSIFCEQNR